MGEPASMAMADFNGNCTLDFAVVDQRSYTVRIRLNEFQLLASTPAGKRPYSVTAYPNPSKFNAPVTITLSTGANKAVMRITDVVGHTISVYYSRFTNTSYHHIQGCGHLPAYGGRGRSDWQCASPHYRIASGMQAVPSEYVSVRPPLWC
jgi:hypothetical protein